MRITVQYILLLAANKPQQVNPSGIPEIRKSGWIDLPHAVSTVFFRKSGKSEIWKIMHLLVVGEP